MDARGGSTGRGDGLRLSERDGGRSGSGLALKDCSNGFGSLSKSLRRLARGDGDLLFAAMTTVVGVGKDDDC